MEEDNKKRLIIENLFNTEVAANHQIAGAFAWKSGEYRVSVLDLITEEEHKYIAETIERAIDWLDMQTNAIIEDRKKNPSDETPRWRHMEQLEQIHNQQPLWVGDLISKDMTQCLSVAGLDFDVLVEGSTLDEAKSAFVDKLTIALSSEKVGRAPKDLWEFWVNNRSDVRSDIPIKPRKARWQEMSLTITPLVLNKPIENRDVSLFRTAKPEPDEHCVLCGKPVEPSRRSPAYASPTCYRCLPPPRPLPIAKV